jgi:hypothetical protein
MPGHGVVRQRGSAKSPVPGLRRPVAIRQGSGSVFRDCLVPSHAGRVLKRSAASRLAGVADRIPLSSRLPRAGWLAGCSSCQLMLRGSEQAPAHTVDGQQASCSPPLALQTAARHSRASWPRAPCIHEDRWHPHTGPPSQAIVLASHAARIPPTQAFARSAVPLRPPHPVGWMARRVTAHRHRPRLVHSPWACMATGGPGQPTGTRHQPACGPCCPGRAPGLPRAGQTRDESRT